jgi:Flp pilus assembly pilin Flp
MQKLTSFAHAATAIVYAPLRGDERGQTMAEYGVVLALVTLAVLGALSMLSGNINSAMESVAGLLP